jgi:hypothetical protein
LPLFCYGKPFLRTNMQLLRGNTHLLRGNTAASPWKRATSFPGYLLLGAIYPISFPEPAILGKETKALG